jgi:DNA recombination protein RmuC
MVAALGDRIKGQQALQVERESAFEAATSRLATAFSDLANQSLKSNSENFLRLAEQNLGAQHERAKRELGDREQAVENLVKPIKDALQQSQAQITALEKSRSEAYGGIKAQLETMQINQKSLTQETQNLVNALRRPEVRGRWGEITLRRLVELAGMVEHCDFQEQVHTTSDEKTIRPDMIVRMPDQRELVVDVKTPLDAYLEAVEAKDDEQRKLGLERHSRNVREHIRKLASKTYWEQFSKSPEFVILFIPGDQFLSAALSEDPDLIEYALSQQIILATPTSFVALLKAVAYGWRQLALADNAEEIRRLAEDLYGRLSAFVGHMNKVGKQLASSVENYNRAVGSLERKVLPGARKFVELGIRPKKEIEQVEPLESLPRSMVESGKDSDDDSGDKTLQ